MNLKNIYFETPGMLKGNYEFGILLLPATLNRQ